MIEFDPKVRDVPSLSPASLPPWLTREHQGTWTCKGAESNTPFTEVELSLDDLDGWTDYDEKASAAELDANPAKDPDLCHPFCYLSRRAHNPSLWQSSVARLNGHRYETLTGLPHALAP